MIKTTVNTALVLALALGVSACSDDDDDKKPVNPLQRDTAQGPVIGTDESGQLAFRGIPYAAPPQGELRFAAPAAAEARSSVLQATQFGSPCPQPDALFAQPSENEDCLSLNVYTPKTDGDYPVMVWIHGGSFTTGSGGGDYDPVRLVAQDVVVVTINYRLGALGFMAHPELSKESDGSGDYGLMDQQAALRWVQDNITKFGGDPESVTVFGESAGGHSIMAQLASPDAAGLFDRVIVQSGSYSPEQMTLAEAETIGTALADKMGCSTAACLRELPVAEILAAQSSNQLPNKRPDLLPLSIAEAISSEDFNQVPVLAGTNSDEGALFIGGEELRLQAQYTADQYAGRIGQLLEMSADSARVSEVVEQYPLDEYDNTSLALTAVYTDRRFACDSLAELRLLSLKVPTYAYEFADRDAPSLIPAGFFDYGAAHAFEIPYLLTSEEIFRAQGVSDQQVALSNTMIQYWTSFAKTGDPNPASGVETLWAPFNTGGFQQLVTPAPQSLSQSDFDAAHQCDSFWLVPS